MRQITFKAVDRMGNERETRAMICASTVANLAYTKQFGRQEDIIGDMQVAAGMDGSPARPGLLQPILWALLVAGLFPTPFPDYESWSKETGEIDWTKELIAAIAEEIAVGFFRSITADARGARAAGA